MSEEELLCAARLAGLELSAEQLPGVLIHFERTAQAAQLLLAVPLEPEDEPAPIWRP